MTLFSKFIFILIIWFLLKKTIFRIDCFSIFFYFQKWLLCNLFVEDKTVEGKYIIKHQTKSKTRYATWIDIGIFESECVVFSDQHDSRLSNVEPLMLMLSQNQTLSIPAPRSKTGSCLLDKPTENMFP